MSKEKDFSAEHDAVIKKWSREEERRKSSAEHIEDSVRDILSKSLKLKDNRVNIAKDLKNATSNRRTFSRESGFGAMDGIDELITGFEPLPWEKD